MCLRARIKNLIFHYNKYSLGEFKDLSAVCFVHSFVVFVLVWCMTTSEKDPVISSIKLKLKNGEIKRNSLRKYSAPREIYRWFSRTSYLWFIFSSVHFWNGISSWYDHHHLWSQSKREINESLLICLYLTGRKLQMCVWDTSIHIYYYAVDDDDDDAPNLHISERDPNISLCNQLLLFFLSILFFYLVI